MDLQLQKWHYRSLKAVKKFEPETKCIWQAGSKDGCQLDELCCDRPVLNVEGIIPFLDQGSDNLNLTPWALYLSAAVPSSLYEYGEWARPG